MPEWNELETWETALTILDGYTDTRKSELSNKQLSPDASLIKSYMMETQVNGINIENGIEDVTKLFRSAQWDLIGFDQNNIYKATDVDGFVGFVEVVSSRYLVLHTLRKTQVVDVHLKNVIRNSAKLDFVWLAGNYLNLLWEFLIRPYMPQRFVAFKFEHQGRFEPLIWDFSDEESEEVEDELVDNESSFLLPLERRSSTLSISSFVWKVAKFLPELQNVLSDFKAVKMLRYPAAQSRGGYDFWDWGKVTYRASSFREGRDYLHSVLDLYRKATDEIERRVWLQVEHNRVSDGTSYFSLKGTPVTFIFPEQLDLATFKNFIDTTFVKGQGPFRLWGDPLILSERKVHVYGVDLHLWQQIYLELTPKRFIAILPHGTCGNTVHRLVSNIQRYLCPDVEVYIGDYLYTKLIQDILVD